MIPAGAPAADVCRGRKEMLECMAKDRTKVEYMKTLPEAAA